jgi:hypothetical protein
MSVLGAGFKVLFLLTSASSAGGFVVAWRLHESDGPSKTLADFSVFMAYSFCLYLFACLGSFYFCARSGESLLAVLLALSFFLPFVLAFLARSYDSAKIVFGVQILALVLGAVSLAWLDAGVHRALLRLV